MDKFELDVLIRRIRFTCAALAEDGLEMICCPENPKILAHEMACKADDIAAMAHRIRTAAKNWDFDGS